MQGAWVWSLVRELRLHMPWGVTKKTTHTQNYTPHCSSSQLRLLSFPIHTTPSLGTCCFLYVEHLPPFYLPNFFPILKSPGSSSLCHMASFLRVPGTGLPYLWWSWTPVGRHTAWFQSQVCLIPDPVLLTTGSWPLMCFNTLLKQSPENYKWISVDEMPSTKSLVQ